MRTDYASAEQMTANREWYVVDAADQVLGRVATEVARLLQGKHRPDFAPHQDNGDFVVVLNADKIRVTGNKADQKVYFRHSGYPGGGKSVPYRRMLSRKPEYIIEHAVRLMLPKNALGRKMFRKLKVYAGNQHPHEAQNPKPFNL
ncbi:MAG TPA: 50S ribosomal protein L13 [Calditrichia bacterium]|nr:50S ribosomal protein L13 [Calditrichota bacterium]HQU71571.1 50S ribosomal protein L13 [Calditrichia bacterium]HQV30919.1 50S ribosomal protein L13 [Calditrichia bacterium]